MKKQVINVMMTLAIVFGLSVSAMAQNTVLNPDTIFAGAAKTFSVDLTSGNTYLWEVLDVTSVTSATGDTYPYEYTTVSATTTGDVTVQTGAGTDNTTDNTNDFDTQFLESAGGLYAIRVTETNGYTGNEAECTTVRDFFVFIVSFDVYVFASTSDGTPISGVDLTSCGPDYAPFHNDHDALATWEGTDPKDTTYITIQLRNDEGTDLLTGYDWRFMFYFLGDNIGDAATYNAGEIQLGAASGSEWAVGTGSYSYAANDSVYGLQLTVNSAAGGSITVPVVNNKLFSNDGSRDIDYNFVVESASTYLRTASTTVWDDGQESATKFDAPYQVNTSAEQTIVSSPATSEISFDN